MKCPKCDSPMEQVEYEGVEVDRCTACKGLWFDSGEKEALGDARSAGDIDVGDAHKGAEMSEIDEYSCPRCSGSMIRMVDPHQSHIWYETCSACGGSFFDAGEFRDLSKKTVSDFFKSLFTPERK